MRNADALEQGRALMDEYSLQNWVLYINPRLTKTLGRCRHNARTLELGAQHVRLNDAAMVIGRTLRHEIAHALVGPGHGHDAVWRRMARELGVPPKTCESSPDLRTSYKWGATCAKCGDLNGGWSRRPQMASRVVTHRKCGSPITVVQRY